MCKGRVLVATLVGPLLLGGCESSAKVGDLFSFKAGDFTSADDPQTTASVPEGGEATSEAPNASGLLGSDPYDDLNTGKKLYRSANYGLAERHFRRAVESRPKDAEAWVGLAASYDQLRRFELADRAYAQAVGIVGKTPEVLNNQGYSYVLRGDYARARVTLLQAKAKDPASPYIQSNLELLEKAVRKRKGVKQNSEK
jgi:Flp pilus assembly protein TadD